MSTKKRTRKIASPEEEMQERAKAEKQGSLKINFGGQFGYLYKALIDPDGKCVHPSEVSKGCPFYKTGNCQHVMDARFIFTGKKEWNCKCKPKHEHFLGFLKAHTGWSYNRVNDECIKLLLEDEDQLPAKLAKYYQ